MVRGKRCMLTNSLCFRRRDMQTSTPANHKLYAHRAYIPTPKSVSLQALGHRIPRWSKTPSPSHTFLFWQSANIIIDDNNIY